MLWDPVYLAITSQMAYEMDQTSLVYMYQKTDEEDSSSTIKVLLQERLFQWLRKVECNLHALRSDVLVGRQPAGVWFRPDILGVQWSGARQTAAEESGVPGSARWK